MFFMYVEKDTFCTEYSRWMDFFIWGNNNEYTILSEMSQGESYNVMT
jgi:hypothetical protein